MQETMTRLVVDTHLHVYPWYNLGQVLTALTANLAALDGEAVQAAVLTERADCSLFADLRDGRTALPPPWTLSRTDEGESLLVTREGGEEIFLLAGRQIVTVERLEVLSLLADPRGLDGRKARDVVKAVTAGGGVPVLAWSPGKWLFHRGRIVAELVDHFRAGDMLTGDTPLRPTVWGEPRLMAAARRKGIVVVAGSDPLPITGEETSAGSYASIVEGPFDDGRPAHSLRALLRTPSAVQRPVGRRCGLAGMLSRIYRNGRAKR